MCHVLFADIRNLRGANKVKFATGAFKITQEERQRYGSQETKIKDIKKCIEICF